jgi:type IV pilus assembly protein PilC
VAWLRLRRARHVAVVQTLASIVGQNLPLPRCLRAAAEQERGAMRRIYGRMAARIEIGDSLATALRSALPVTPGRVLGAVQAGEAGGTTAGVLRDLAEELRLDRPAANAPGTPLPYLLGMLFALPAVLGFILVTVVPRFHEIFLDFEIELPASTQWLIAVSAADATQVVVPIALLVLLGGGLQIGIGRHFLVRVPDRYQWPAAMLDRVLWRIPGLRRLSESRALARQMAVLEAAVNAGHDLPAAARQAAKVDANWVARQRLRRWADLIEGGEDAAEAARLLGFPAAVRSGLAAARTQELGSALAYLALYYRGLTFHWERVLAAVLTPCIVLAWAACVGFVVLALFLPLVVLIDGVADSVY